MATCRRYLRHVHRSVFDGKLTNAQLSKLKRELEALVDPRKDSVRIYRLESTRYVSKDELGLVRHTLDIL